MLENMEPIALELIGLELILFSSISASHPISLF